MSNEDVEGYQNLEFSGMETSLVPSSSEKINSARLISPSTSRTSSPTSHLSTIGPSTERSSIAKARKRKSEDELLKLVRERLKTPEEDEHDAFAKTVAFKLRKLNPAQCFYAEKLIIDVLYEAGLGELGRMSYVVARPPSVPVAQYAASGHDDV